MCGARSSLSLALTANIYFVCLCVTDAGGIE